MRKPNYGMERKDRELAKQAKAAAKVEKRGLKGDQGRTPEESATGDQAGLDETQGQKQGD